MGTFRRNANRQKESMFLHVIIIFSEPKKKLQLRVINKVILYLQVFLFNNLIDS